MKPQLLIIDGAERLKHRKQKWVKGYLVKIDDHEFALSYLNLMMLVSLAIHRNNGNGGWMPTEFITEEPHYVRATLWRLRRQILASLPDNYVEWPVLENNKQGGYRIAVSNIQIGDAAKRLFPALTEYHKN